MRQLQPSGDGVDLFAAYAQPRPGVRVNFVAAADGAATLDGRSEGLSSPADKLVFRVLRAMADVVLVGAGTARIEGYGPVRLPADHREWRLAHSMPPVPPLAVVSRSLALDPASRMFAEADVRPLILTCTDAPAAARQALAAVADIVTGDSPADWLARLSERGLTHLLCEGGPTLFGSLLDQDLVDELCLTLSPMLTRQHSPGIVEERGDQRPLRLDLLHVLEEDDYLFLRYAVRHG